MLATSMAGMAGSSLVCVHAHTSIGASGDAECSMVDNIIPSDSKPVDSISMYSVSIW